MVNAEEVVINIIANDYATKKLQSIRSELDRLASVQSNIGKQATIVNQQSSTISEQTPSNSFSSKSSDESEKYKKATENAKEFGEESKKAGEQSETAFHRLGNIMEAVGGKFQDISTKIAGLFGTVGLGGMIEKMWKGAAERQTNMLYLIHQKGVEEANEYYNEIMDIVTQLPGDDTFLTNILNMASAMDKNIKVDNLKALGEAITDYYIASTMKGELPFETERDIRKYITTGETRGLRNSLLANEIDMLKNKNSVLERSEALQKALEKTGFKGMSEYESATNELEEFKGHFQKAFADLGTIITSVTQPLLKFYNTIDTIFGSRISQIIIVLATLFITLFAVIGGGMIVFSSLMRMGEIVISLGMLGITVTKAQISGKGTLFGIIELLAGAETAEAIAKEGGIRAALKKTATTIQEIIVDTIYTGLVNTETFSIYGLITSIGSLIIAKIGKLSTTIKEIIYGVTHIDVISAENILEIALTDTKVALSSVIAAKLVLMKDSIFTKLEDFAITVKLIIVDTTSALVKFLKGKATWSETKATILSTKATKTHTGEIILETLATIKSTVKKAADIIVSMKKVVVEWLLTGSTLTSAMASSFDAVAKELEAGATLSAAIATAILEAELAPLVLVVVLLAGVIIGLVIVVEKVGEAFGLWKDGGEMAKKVIENLIYIIFPFIGIIEKVGEAFGWWEDLGSMLDAIGKGLSRMWNAFANSDVVQGIVKYFTDFVNVVQYLIESILKLFGLADDNSDSFDIVQSIINVFGKLGDVIMWVWNIMDDWSNSPFGFITWLNPLGILIFHLDELGSLFEDIGDAINEFMESTEFNSMVNEFNQAIEELKEPFQEIWDLINEIFSIIGDIFSDPEGKGTEERVNFLVGIFKGLANIIRVVVIPAIRGIAFAIKVMLIPLKIILTVIRAVVGAIQYATKGVDVFGVAWQVLTAPLRVIQGIIQKIGDLINIVSNAIKHSIIGKLLGWDKEDNKDDESKHKSPRDTLYKQMKNNVNSSDMNPVVKHKIMSELDKQNINSGNVNNVRNLGQTYNNTNNERQVVIHQHFSEGSMPIDARNMTKKEARMMFINAFGYRRAVGSGGILR